MTTADRINLASLGASLLGVFVSALAGLLTPFVASVVAISICVLAWMIWVTHRLLPLRVEPTGTRSIAISLGASTLPYSANYASL